MGKSQPILKAAYGRIYETFDAVDTAYATGADFEYTNPVDYNTGLYCSCRDFVGQRVTLLFGDRHQLSSDIMVHVVEPAEYRGADYGDDEI